MQGREKIQTFPEKPDNRRPHKNALADSLYKVVDS